MNTMIPMVDLKNQYQILKPVIDQAVLDVLANAHYILGENVKTFEEEVCAYMGAKHAIGCANGTDALHLALLAAGVGKGDEVITTAFTFIATAEAIRYVGATPVFVDIDERTFNIDPAQIEKAISDKTKAIIPVHLFGQPANMPKISQIARAHQLLIIEDCAQSFGASVGEHKTGTIGDIGCFSFFPSKNLGCFGDGGMVICHDDALAERLRVFANHGQTKRYHHQYIGLNSRLDELQAAILRQKLPHIDSYNQHRREVAASYNQKLSGTLQTPHCDDIGRHVYHQYTTLCKSAQQRSQLQQKLSAANIASAIYYPITVPKQQAFADLPTPTLPVSEYVAEHCLSLPIFPEMTEAQIIRVADAIHS